MMRLDWILHPAMQYGILALALGLCLYLFFTLKLEIRALQQRQDIRAGALAEQLAAARAAIEELRSGLREAQEQTGLLVPPTPPKSGLNLGKRSQALRLHRRGDSPEAIAASLGLPVSEVELLVKVHRIVLDQVG